MSCKKIYNIDMVVIMEEEFATVEEAANQSMPSEKGFVVEVSSMKLTHSNIKKEDADGKHQKSSAGTDGHTEGKK